MIKETPVVINNYSKWKKLQSTIIEKYDEHISINDLLLLFQEFALDEFSYEFDWYMVYDGLIEKFLEWYEYARTKGYDGRVLEMG